MALGVYLIRAVGIEAHDAEQARTIKIHLSYLTSTKVSCPTWNVTFADANAKEWSGQRFRIDRTQSSVHPLLQVPHSRFCLPLCLYPPFLNPSGLATSMPNRLPSIWVA
jgi:hypothetical protein